MYGGGHVQKCGQCGAVLVRGPTGPFCQYCNVGADGLKGRTQIARPANNAAVAWRFQDGFPQVNAELLCLPNESALFVAGGRLIGYLPAGRYALTTSSAPFLSAVAAGPAFNAELYIVRTDDCRVSIDARVGTLLDPHTSTTVTITLDAAAFVRVADPARIVNALTSSSIEAEVTDAVTRCFRNALAAWSSHGESLLSLVSPARTAALVPEALNGAAHELAPLGLALTAIHPANLSIDDQSMGNLANAHRAAQSGAKSASGSKAAAYSGAVAGGIVVGATVRAQWTDGGYYGATVRAVHGDKVEVLWHDGTGAMWVHASQILADGDKSTKHGAAYGTHNQPSLIPIGSHVKAQWTNSKWYGATVDAFNGGHYLVRWDDGSTPLWVRADQVLPDGQASAKSVAVAGAKGLAAKVIETVGFGAFQRGQHVQARWTNGKFYGATVVQQSADGTHYEVAWDDGTGSLWVPSSDVRNG